MTYRSRKRMNPMVSCSRNSLRKRVCPTVLAGLLLAGSGFDVQAGEAKLLSSPDGRI
jgi:hypothetical protein